MNPRFYPITLGTFESLDILLSIFAHPDDAMSKWVRNVRFGSRLCENVVP
jgi:hypothetical protein